MPGIKSVDHVAVLAAHNQFETESIAAEAVTAVSHRTSGAHGEASERSRALRMLAVGKSKVPIGGGLGLESVLGDFDRRQRILETELFPWRMICSLSITGSNGSQFMGTGWFIGPKTLLTAGHCVHHRDDMGGWASSIEVWPGRDDEEKPFGSIVSNRFSTTDVWINSLDPDFDIGCIHLDEALGERTGWFATTALPPKELATWMVNVSGYPGDLPSLTDPRRGTMQYHHRNRVLRVSERRMFYDVDTYGGQSGAPVWIQESEDSPPVAVGVHAYGEGGTPLSFNIKANSAPRFTTEVLDMIAGWIDSGGPSA